jgi:uncharacterized protein YabE (DUF348 family)
LTVPPASLPNACPAPPADARAGSRNGRSGVRRLLRLAAGGWLSRRLAGWCLAGLAVVMLAAGYYASAVPITLTVDGLPRHMRTHQTSVEGVLREADIRLHPEDLITPPLNTPLAAGSIISIRLARPVTIEADGRNVELRTQRRRVADVLAEADIQVKPSDEVLVDGQTWNLNADLPQAVASPAIHRGPGLSSPAPASSTAAPVRIVVHRAVPVILTDGAIPATFYTTQPTVGEALLAQDIFLYLGDRVTPSLGSRVLPGMRIYIERSLPVSIGADGQTLRTRTQRSTVGEALAQEGIALVGQDYSLPTPDTPLTADMAIRVVRVREAIEIEQETIPFETNWVATSTLAIDTQKVEQAGGEGLTKRRLRTVFQDGQAITTTLEDEWIDHPPSTKIIAYGTKVTVQKLETPDGIIEYWRHFRILATSYSAATSGKEKDDPYYGITRTGMKASYGVVAVDPKVIALHSEVYIPGYGKAVAGDTGGSILGRHIDLGFDEETPPLWYRWVDVYLLTPKPPASQIRYVLPNWPQER